jgi:hypothetical protein
MRPHLVQPSSKETGWQLTFLWQFILKRWGPPLYIDQTVEWVWLHCRTLPPPPFEGSPPPPLKAVASLQYIGLEPQQNPWPWIEICFAIAVLFFLLHKIKFGAAYARICWVFFSLKGTVSLDFHLCFFMNRTHLFPWFITVECTYVPERTQSDMSSS